MTKGYTVLSSKDILIVSMDSHWTIKNYCKLEISALAKITHSFPIPYSQEAVSHNTYVQINAGTG